MALITLNYYSCALGHNTNVKIVLPEKTENYNGTKKVYKTLYLLHGLGGDSSSWLRNTNLESQFRESDVCVVCPEVSQSFYLNQSSQGLRYFDYITNELPKFLKSILPLSHRREDTFIAGASMGGYGACLCAFTSSNYSKVAVFSGALDIQRLIDNVVLDDFVYSNAFDNLNVRGSNRDVLQLAQDSVNFADMSILLYCGKQDILYEDTQSLKNILDSKSIDYCYVEDEGKHDWISWQKHVADLLLFVSN